jgi:hypothetical protein
MHNVPPKPWCQSIKLHAVPSQKALTAIRNSDLIKNCGISQARNEKHKRGAKRIG